jgi:hypothetical protein
MENFRRVIIKYEQFRGENKNFNSRENQKLPPKSQIFNEVIRLKEYKRSLIIEFITDLNILIELINPDETDSFKYAKSITLKKTVGNTEIIISTTKNYDKITNIKGGIKIIQHNQTKAENIVSIEKMRELNTLEQYNNYLTQTQEIICQLIELFDLDSRDITFTTLSLEKIVIKEY